MSDDQIFHQVILGGIRERLGNEGRFLSFEEWQQHKAVHAGSNGHFDAKDMKSVVDLALSTLTGLYVHIQLKRTRRGVEPMRQLQMLREQLDSGEQIHPDAFHRRMLEVFKSLGDVHTAYRVPDPHRRTIAFLPFILGEYFEEDQPRYVVTRTLWDGWEEWNQRCQPPIRCQTEITHWNGTPIAEAVRRSAEFEEGSNAANDRALGLHFMTLRWLGASFEPESPWVIVSYKDTDDTPREHRFFWTFLRSREAPVVTDQARAFVLGGGEDDSTADPIRVRANARSCNTASEIVHRERCKLFVVQPPRPKSVRPDPAKPDPEVPTETLGDKLTKQFARPVNRQRLIQFSRKEGMAVGNGRVDTVLPFFDAWTHKGSQLLEYQDIIKSQRALRREECAWIEKKEFGYIGIRGFALIEPQRTQFNYEFRRLLTLMPTDGLILDIRDNPGGSTNNAEESLQFMTPNTITPLPFRFVASATTRRLARKRANEVKEYKESIDDALVTGAAFSAGRPITDPSDANALGQYYFGPVVLLTNALTYSAGDIFAAGFEDNEIGTILGVDETTGGGGANCWFYGQDIRPAIDGAPLPLDIDMQLAVRQCERVGRRNLGLSIEEVGVRSRRKCRYKLTREDVLGHERRPWGLLLRAAVEVCRKPSYDLQILDRSAPTSEGDKHSLLIESKNIDRLDFYVDGRPTACDVDPSTQRRDGMNETSFELLVRASQRVELQIRGFNRKSKLVARSVRVLHG